ncbi:MAG: DUF1579 domain-containing protein [Armatimonadetes bacterium]|nr:DUF1579 domain-containing protein [Armatimonadota bacterium]
MKFEPQPEHRWLAKFIGEWTGEGEAVMEPGKPPVSFKAAENVRALGDLWVAAEGRGETPCGGSITSLMALGYDPHRQRYACTWVCSIMPHLWMYEGTLDPTGKTLTLEAEGPGIEGKTCSFRDVVSFEGDNHRVLASYMKGEDDEWHRFMAARYRRVK